MLFQRSLIEERDVGVKTSVLLRAFDLDKIWLEFFKNFFLALETLKLKIGLNVGRFTPLLE